MNDGRPEALPPSPDAREAATLDFRETVYRALRRLRETPEPTSGVRVGALSYHETVAFDTIVAALTAFAATESVRLEPRDADATTDREMLQDVLDFARSGWRKDDAPFYCLVCDESLCLRPGAVKGQRAATFEEIAHDPECPIPLVAAHLSRDSVAERSAAPSASAASRPDESTMQGFTYERISPDKDGGTHWRVSDPEDNRVATCWQEANARMVTNALNRGAPSASAARQTDATTELERVAQWCDERRGHFERELAARLNSTYASEERYAYGNLIEEQRRMALWVRKRIAELASVPALPDAGAPTDETRRLCPSFRPTRPAQKGYGPMYDEPCERCGYAYEKHFPGAHAG